jgi:hypothetical protein
MTLETAILLAGLGQAMLLVGLVQVPARLHWRTELQPLSRTHRQMHWVYGGYMKPYLTRPWMKAGNLGLTPMFASVTAVYAWAAARAGDAL